MKRLLPLLLVLGAFFSQQSAQAQGLGVYVNGITMVVDTSITINDSLIVTGDIVDRGSLIVLNLGDNPRIDSVKFCRIDSYGKIDLPANTSLHLTGNYEQLDSFVCAKSSILEFYGRGLQTYKETPSPTTPYKLGHLIVNTDSIGMQSNMTVMPGGQVEFWTAGSKTNRINTRTNKLIMEANATENADFIGFDASQGGPAVTKNYVNNHIWFQALNTNKTIYNFPVGSNASLQLMKLEFPAGTVGGNNIKLFDVELIDINNSSAPAACDVTAPEYYSEEWEYKPYSDLTATTRVNELASGSYTITLNPRAYSINSAPARQNFTTYFLHTGDAAFHPETNTAPPNYCFNFTNPAELVTPGLTKFSKARAAQSGQDDKPFPNNNITLNATGGRNNINVGWQVEIPREVAFFNLERSTDGRNFQTIQANITAESTRNGYGFTDRNVKKNQTYFYRVLVSTTTKEAKYTRIVQAKVSELGQQSANLQTNLYPNPTDGSLNLEINAGENETVGLKIVDAIGRIVIQKNLDVENGTNRFDLTGEVMKLAGGTYNLVLTSENGISTTKLVKN